MKTNLYKYIKVFFGALCVIAVIVGTMGCHVQETERQTDGAVQAQECSVFPKAESGVDLNDFFVADEEPEVDTYGDFNLRGYFDACGWDQNYAHPYYGEYVVDSSLFQGAHASLMLDGYEHTMFAIRDICGLALVRIESDYPHERVRIVDSDYDEISTKFLLAMNEVFDCIREAKDADSLEESLEAIRASSVEINILTYEEAEALFPKGPEVGLEVRNWYNELSNTFDLPVFLANYGWGDDIDHVSYGLCKISSDNGTIYLRLDPREAAFVVDADGIVVEGVWDASESEFVRIPRIGENAPKPLLVALNAVLDRVTNPQYADYREEELEAFGVEHMTVKLCGNMEDTSVSKMLNPEARHVIEIGGKQIATVNSVDDWRLDPASSKLVPELMFDSFDLRSYSDEDVTHGYHYDIRLDMWAEDDDAINAFSLELTGDDGLVAYQVIVKRFGDERVVETTDGWNASRDLLDILIFTLEEWRYGRTELGDYLTEFADGNGLGDSLYLEVIQF